MGYWSDIESGSVNFSVDVSNMDEYQLELKWWQNNRIVTAISPGTIKTPILYRSSGRYRGRFIGTSRSGGTNVTQNLTTPQLTSKGNTTKIQFNRHTIRGAGDVIGTIYLQEYIPTPPHTPTGLTVPSKIKWNTNIVVSWNEAPYATSYQLFWQINGGAWTSIRTTSSTSATVYIPKDNTLSTIAFRVRSIGVDGGSGYATSPTVRVLTFPNLKININGTLREGVDGWVAVNNESRDVATMTIKKNNELINL